MEIKKVIKQDGEYQCDIDVTVEEWKKILQDKTIMNKNYVDVLLKFYTEPEHKSTCKELGTKYDKSPQSFNGTITNFAKATQKKLNRFEVIGTDGESSYWIIAMTGKYKGEYFEWTMRPELVKAIEEIDIKKTIYFDMDYFNLTEENIALLTDDIGKKYDRNSRGVSIYLDTREKLKYLGKLLGEELRISLKNNYNEKPNKQAGRGKGFVLKEYILAGFIPEKYHKETSKNLFIKLCFWGFNTNKPQFGVDIDVNFYDRGNKFNKLRKSFQERSWSIPIKNLPNNWIDLINLVKPQFKWMTDYIDSYFLKIKTSKEMIPYLKLLKANKNLILTGAPGTGKTFLAKQIAKEVGEWEFVQFHPSFDYTDFVEGLRPLKKNAGELGFELRDGIFKAFCKKARRNLIDSSKSEEELKEQKTVSEKLSLFIAKVDNEIAENGEYMLEGIGGNPCAPIIEINPRNFITKSKNNNTLSTPLNNILAIYEKYKLHKELDWSYKEVGEKLGVTYHHTYFFAFVKALDEFINSNSIDIDKVDKIEKQYYVFIIDEINRAEISKVFGELFFSIDPSYRGEKGKVKTQYSNLQDESDMFFDGFYIPENVYIIGTMNDIDRSVESFDFAMRRRFTWVEITAEESAENMNLPHDIKERMLKLNKQISATDGLNYSYHIGAAYFLDSNGKVMQDIVPIWNLRIEPLMKEYLRGMPESIDKIKKIKNAFFS